MALDSGKKTTTIIIVINIVIVFNIIRDKNLALGGTLLGNKHLIAADYVAIIIGCKRESIYQMACKLNGKTTGKEMLMLVSSLGVQSNIARRTVLFSTLVVPLVGI